LAIYVNGGGFAESNTFTISFSIPQEGQSFTNGDLIISGFATGGILNSVIVWDQKYNIGMYAGTNINLWSLSIPIKSFSDGPHILCVKAQSTNGEWSPTISRTINTYPTSHVDPTGYISDTIPGIGLLFRPAEELGRSIVVLVSGGTAPDDQNGDNIPDVFQQSPIAPNYNPSNVPIMMSLVFVVIIVMIIVIVYGVKEFLLRRQATPEYWKLQERKLSFKLQRSRINEKDKWLKQEIQKREDALAQAELGKKAVEQKNKELETLLANQRMFNTQKKIFHVDEKPGAEIPLSKQEFQRAAATLGIKRKGKVLDVTRSQYQQIKGILENKTLEDME
jgi:hypothetical protein